MKGRKARTGKRWQLPSQATAEVLMEKENASSVPGDFRLSFREGGEHGNKGKSTEEGAKKYRKRLPNTEGGAPAIALPGDSGGAYGEGEGLIRPRRRPRLNRGALQLPAEQTWSRLKGGQDSTPGVCYCHDEKHQQQSQARAS